MTSDLAARCAGLLDGPTLAAFLGVPASTVRWWASEGLLQRRGTGPRNRTLYDVREAARLAARRGRLTAPS